MLLTPDSSAAIPTEPSVVRDEAGRWCYDGTQIPAVGARDITLGEVVKPRMLGRPDERPEAVVLSLQEIIKDARLNWVLQVGTKLDGADDALFLVPLAIWEERAAEPVGAWLPEHDATGVDRLLASSERQWRFAKNQLDEAGRARMRLILLASRMGKSRREVGETLGLSTGRVQQLNEDPPADLVAEVDHFVRDAVDIAAGLEAHPSTADAIRSRYGLGSDRVDEVVADMLALGLLAETADGLTVTSSARALLAAGSRDRVNPRTARRVRSGHGQASNASS